MANGRVEVLKKDQVVDLFTTPLECAIFPRFGLNVIEYVVVCHPYVFVCHPYVTRMSFVYHPYVIHMSLVCTRMSPYVLVCYPYVFVCHPYVTRMYSYVTRMYSYVIRMSLACGFTMNSYQMYPFPITLW